MRQPGGRTALPMLVHHPLGPWPRPLAAIAALALTLVLGLVGPALPGPRALLGWGGLGLVLAGSAGLLAWHVARLSVTPAGNSGFAGAALPASLLALTVPQMGAAALLVPCALALATSRHDPAQRLAAIAVQCGALALLMSSDAPLLGALASATVPALALLSLRGAERAVANDNPSLERTGSFSPLQLHASYASPPRRDSETSKWGVGHVRWEK